MNMFQKKITRRLLYMFKFPILSVVDDKLNIIGFFGLMTKTLSYGERPILVQFCELKE